MTNHAIIGPIILPERVTYNPSINQSNDRSPKITTNSMSNYLASDIQGIVSPGKRGNNTLSRENIGWGPIWFDGASGISNPLDVVRGWILLRNAEKKYVNQFKSKLSLEMDIISKNKDEYLYMDYTTGDIRVLSTDYIDQETIYNLNEEFNDLVTNWENPLNSPGFTGSGWEISEEKAQCSCAASVDGTWVESVLISKNKYNPHNNPYYLEFNMEWLAQPTSGNYNHYIAFFLYDRKPATYAEAAPWVSSANWIGVYLLSSYSGVTCHLIKHITGNVQLTPPSGIPLSISEKTPNFRIYVSDMGISFWVDEEGDGFPTTSTWGFADIGINLSRGAYLVLSMGNQDSSNAIMKSDYVNVYRIGNATYQNTVFLPAGCTQIVEEDAIRTGSEGDVLVYNNPIEKLLFQNDVSDPENLYKGTVKVYSTLYDELGRQVFNLDEELDPLHSIMHNTLIKLETTVNSLKIYYWSELTSDWELYDTLGVGTINSFKLTEINPMRAVLKINYDIYITLEMGRRGFDIEHPTTPVTFTRKGNYEHDNGLTEDPAANIDITMNDIYYCNIYNDEDRYRLQINKQYTDTIKSDSVPASLRTGFIIYDNNEGSSSLDHYSKLCREWRNKTIQRMAMNSL